MADPGEDSSQSSAIVADSNTQKRLASVDTLSDMTVPSDDVNAQAIVDTPERDVGDQQDGSAAQEVTLDVDQPSTTTPSGEETTVDAVSDQLEANNGLELGPGPDSLPEPTSPQGDQGYPGFDQNKDSETDETAQDESVPGSGSGSGSEIEEEKEEEEDSEHDSEDEFCLGKVPEDLDDDSPSRLEWLRQKREEGAVSKTLDQAMCLIGLEEVKAELLQGKAAIEARRRRGENLAENVIMWSVQDNTGIDDYFIRRLFNRLEKEMSLDRSQSSKLPGELRYVKLANYADGELQVLLTKMIKNMGMSVEGGIDGPYPRLLAARIGRTRGTYSFGNLYSVKEALKKAIHRQAVRLHRDRVEWTKNGEQGEAPDDFVLTKEDLLGLPPVDMREKSQSYRDFNAMVGLSKFKEVVEELMDLPRANYELEMEGKPQIKINLNRVFMGPAGTGKTTAVKLFAQILIDLGLVPENRLIYKDPRDLISHNSALAAKKMHDALVAAQGAVLIIDNASELCPQASNRASADTLATDVTAASGMDGCIMLVGEAQGLRDMFEKCHLGLRTRFAFDEAFEFEDYDPPELIEILEAKLAEVRVTASGQAKKVAEQVFARARHKPGFGNCNNVDVLLRKGLTSRRLRLRNERAAAAGKISGGSSSSVPKYSFWMDNSALLEPEDFDPDWQRGSEVLSRCDDLFKEFVGFGQIVRQFTRYQEIVSGMRLHGIDPGSHIPFTFVFKGPPGTGKTSTARKLGQIFYDMGFLTTNEVVECSVSDFIGSHLGETAPKLRALLDKALGKVLFIDEAYRMATGIAGQSTGRSFEEEAVGELVDSLTKERYRRKVVVILVGYSDDMDRLMKANRGLHSRFATEVVFPQLTPGQCIKFLGQLVGNMGVSIRDRADPDPRQKEKVLRVMGKLIATRDWSNGRDIETLAADIVGDVYSREGRKGEKSARLQISTEELVKFLLDMLKGRRAGELADEE